MLPAHLMGLNISKFRKNLLIHLQSKDNNFLKDSSIKLTKLLKNKKIKNLIFFNYVPHLDKFLFWCQQLIAESLGKKGLGFLPVISPAPKDHHSLLQLYLDGPKDKLFYIFSSELKGKIKISSKVFGKQFDFLNNKSFNQIKIAQKNAFVQSLKEKKIPFREFKIKDFSEEVLGELFSYFILETAIIGELSNINPFNQPAVEQVKINTKKKLN
jgi:glucose-6-phosphate isomerase